MKKSILFILVIGSLAFQINAQNNVFLNINHKLKDVDFALNQATKNNMNHDFKITRLEYYISKISLIHDGGDTTRIEDLWILVNADSETSVDLGIHNINNVENIIFYVGVDPDHNHLDPTLWPTGHPLAPSFPSMHWGWASGYRFVAIEGQGGANLNQLFQLHGVGDILYFRNGLELDITASNGILNIDLDADYTRALEDISLNSGVIVHGDNLQARKCLENFKNFVFSPSNITSSIIDISEINEFNVYPNPIINGISTVKLDVEKSGFKYDLSITSLDGRQLDYLYNVTDNQTLDFSSKLSGMYFINLIKEGQTIITKKVFVK